jgi:amidase
MQVALSFGPPGAPIDPDVKAAVVQAGRILSRHGYEVTEHDPPSLADSALFDLLWTESDTLLWDTISAVGSPAMQRLFQSYLSASKRLDLRAFLKALAARTTFCRDWFQFLEKFTLVLAPASLRLPFGVREDVEGPSSIDEVLGAQIMLATVNFLGLPAACVPTGVNAAGVPLGVQIIGSRYREDLCLDAAQVIENDVGVLADRLWQRQKNPAPMRVNR